MKSRRIKFAVDLWDSVRFTNIILVLGLLSFQAESHPGHLQVMQTVGLSK